MTTSHRMGRTSALSLLAALAVLVALVLATAPPSEASTSTCGTTVRSGWSATVCLDVTGTGTLSGPSTVSSTVDVSSNGPRVAKLEYSLRNVYLLTDYEVPYSFSLDTADYRDGAARLSVVAIFRDGTTSSATSVDLTFGNGNATDPGPSGSFTPPTAPAPTKSNPLLLAAVGDGAGGETAATQVTDMISTWNPELFTYLGDVYDNGTITEFHNWYGDSNTWYGQFRDITAPVVGNHEYDKDAGGNYVADGYFRYWNDIPHYYSFNAGGWHFIALDSTSQFGQTDPGTPQYQWLKSDLAAHQGECTVAMWHHPLETVGAMAPAQRMSAMWSLLAQNNVTLVLNGHDHQYQRWTPLDTNQQPAAGGVTEIVAGAGGHSSQGILGNDARAVATATGYGALKMEVYPERIDYTYRLPDGGSGKVVDNGFVGCTSLSADTTAPTPPGSLTATLVQQSSATYSADLAWTPGDDDRGVAQYRIRSGDTVIATIPSAQSTYVVKGLKPDTTASFTVTSLDAAGNESVRSPAAGLTTPGPHPATVQVIASADTYTSEQQPTRNYGHSNSLRMDSSPLVQTYLKFDVSGSWSDVSKATLHLTANQKSNGIDVRAVPPTWDEYGLTAANAPSAGAIVASSGAFAAGPVDIDVTGAVTGNGTYSFLLSTGQSTAFTVGSRESGDATAPTLTVESDPPPDTTPPTTPTGLTAAAPTQGQVDLAWNASSDADAVDSYTVYRNGTAVDTVPGDTTTYTDTNVQAATTYTYAVDAVDPSGNRSPKSATASATPPDETPPEIEGLDVVLTGPDSVGLRWGEASDNVGVTGYRVERNGSVLANLPADATGFDDTSVQAGQDYTYALTAGDAAGNRSQAVTGSITVPSGSGGTPPTVPTNVTATATSETGIVVEWTQSTDDTGMSGYEVFRDGAQVALLGPSADAWLDSGLAPGSTHSYTVRGIDLDGMFSDLSSPPATATTWTPDTTAPTVPSGVTASGASLTSIAVSWTASTDARGVAGYRVYRDGTAVADVGATATSWTDTGLVTGSSHDYQVDAVDGSGNRSAKSATATGTTQVPSATTLTFAVDADAYVNSASPTSKYGGATSLRLDGSPVVDSWLHFTVSGLQPNVTKAVLRIYANQKNSSGFDVHTTATPWSESTLSFATAPSFGPVAATSDPTTASGWVEVPVTPIVTGDGDVTLVLTQTGSTAVSYQSRESGGATAAQLVVTSGY